MSNFLKVNLGDVDDSAPKFGMGEIQEARFATKRLDCERIGLTVYAVKPGRRLGFGHSHDQDEEVYLVLSGSGRFKIDDEVIEVGARDVVRFPPATVREWEAGEDGMEFIAFGTHHEDEKGHMDQEFWKD
jgi:quercetin dioxygenase-like cupin family protein